MSNVSNSANTAALFQLETPCFVFDEAELVSNFTGFQHALRNSWGERAHLAYSVKTNPHPWVLQVAKECDCWAEVVSDQEYDLALGCDFSTNRIIFNGPIKGKEHFFAALQTGSVVNLDSAREIRWLTELATTTDQPLSVGLRVNIDLERYCPGETTSGNKGGRFGYCLENGELARVIAEVRAIGSCVRIAGLHMHVTTYSRSLEVYRTLAHHAACIAENFSLDLDFIDIGGGFFGGGPKNVGAYADYGRVIAEELVRVLDPSKTSLFIEPGGAVVCTPGKYMGRVLDAKDTGYDRFVTCELSRVNIDHEMKKTAYAYEIISHDGNTNRELMDRQVLCGFSCMESDRLCVLEQEASLEEGDLLIFNNAGAYSLSFTPGFFIQYAPAVYALKTDGSYQLLDSHTPQDCRAVRTPTQETPA